MRLVLGLFLAFLAVAGAEARSKVPPRAAPPSAAPHVMVAAASPAAVEAGLKVLRAGGSAVDAAVAVQATLGLVEPQSSGIGGGAFLGYYHARAHPGVAHCGPRGAPAGRRPGMFPKGDR